MQQAGASLVADRVADAASSGPSSKSSNTESSIVQVTGRAADTPVDAVNSRLKMEGAAVGREDYIGNGAADEASTPAGHFFRLCSSAGG
jgi:hypothetical protein